MVQISTTRKKRHFQKREKKDDYILPCTFFLLKESNPNSYQKATHCRTAPARLYETFLGADEAQHLIQSDSVRFML